MDLISRQAAIDVVKHAWAKNLEPTQFIEDLPSVQPEIIRCKDCKHWKDSDGIYRRGVDAESKCPVNIQDVYDGIFYCGYAERKTDDLQ